MIEGQRMESRFGSENVFEISTIHLLLTLNKSKFPERQKWLLLTPFMSQDIVLHMIDNIDYGFTYD